MFYNRTSDTCDSNCSTKIFFIINTQYICIDRIGNNYTVDCTINTLNK